MSGRRGITFPWYYQLSTRRLFVKEERWREARILDRDGREYQEIKGDKCSVILQDSYCASFLSCHQYLVLNSSELGLSIPFAIAEYRWLQPADSTTSSRLTASILSMPLNHSIESPAQGHHDGTAAVNQWRDTIPFSRLDRRGGQIPRHLVSFSSPHCKLLSTRGCLYRAMIVWRFVG